MGFVSLLRLGISNKYCYSYQSQSIYLHINNLNLFSFIKVENSLSAKAVYLTHHFKTFYEAFHIYCCIIVKKALNFQPRCCFGGVQWCSITNASYFIWMFWKYRRGVWLHACINYHDCFLVLNFEYDMSNLIWFVFYAPASIGKFV
jgi:hypothetical protein